MGLLYPWLNGEVLKGLSFFAFFALLMPDTVPWIYEDFSVLFFFQIYEDPEGLGNPEVDYELSKIFKIQAT